MSSFLRDMDNGGGGGGGGGRGFRYHRRNFMRGENSTCTLSIKTKQ